MQSLRAQRRALQHAEPMLLVDDHEPELRETARRPAPAHACRRRGGSRRPRSRRAARGARAAPVDARSAARRGSATRCSSREMFTKCCSARISVGAMNATCSPFSIATSAASSATIVLPAPTSPCSSRFIGCGRCMSSTISLSACRCPGVSLNGSTARADSRMRSSTRDRRRLRARAAPPGAAPARPSGTGTPLRRSAAAAPASRSGSARRATASAGGKCVASSAACRDGRPSRDADRLRHRIGQIRRAAAGARRDTIRRCIFGVTRAGLLVDRHDPPGVDRLAFLVVEDLVLRDWSAAGRRARASRPAPNSTTCWPAREHVAQERLVRARWRAAMPLRVADERFEDLEARTPRRAQRRAHDPADDRARSRPGRSDAIGCRWLRSS